MKRKTGRLRKDSHEIKDVKHLNKKKLKKWRWLMRYRKKNKEKSKRKLGGLEKKSHLR